MVDKVRKIWYNIRVERQGKEKTYLQKVVKRFKNYLTYRARYGIIYM